MADRQTSIFGGSARMQMTESIELTILSLKAHGAQHAHWGIAWSGGKDSTATLTLIVYLITSGQIPAPKSLTVFYADTRMELPPLAIAALRIMEQLRAKGIQVNVVRAPMDKRFFVYILGRGVPPPNNNTLRWCTRQIKVDPMSAAIGASIAEVEGSLLMITGVRQGESAVRDRRIEMSCGKDGAECGQGWYQQVLPNAKGLRGRIATLAPLLHWRVCHVWDWLQFYAPDAEYGGWDTRIIADAYGGDEAEEVNARTGCIGCPLAQEEKALEAILKLPDWDHLTPLRELKPLYRELREPHNRLKKAGVERLKDGSIGKNPQRMGPLTFDARRYALKRVLAIQARCNEAGLQLSRPPLDILDRTETDRIVELIDAKTWPNGWDGDEPTGDVMMSTIYQNGAEQPLLFNETEMRR